MLITVGEEFTISGSVNDSNGDAVTVTTNMPGATVTMSENDFTITATVTNTTAARITITAKVCANVYLNLFYELMINYQDLLVLCKTYS